jgi:hypothetical protein
VSAAGGSHPNSKGDGTELYFISAEGQLVTVPFGSHGSSIDVGTQTNLFRMPGIIQITAGSHNMYQADHAGQRFLVAVKAEVTNVPPINLILNWPQLLTEKRLAQRTHSEEIAQRSITRDKSPTVTNRRILVMLARHG